MRLPFQTLLFRGAGLAIVNFLLAIFLIVPLGIVEPFAAGNWIMSLLVLAALTIVNGFVATWVVKTIK